MFTDAGLNRAKQELLRGVFRHTVVATTVAHDGDDLGHTHESAQCLVRVAALFQELQLLSRLADNLCVGHIVENGYVVAHPVLCELILHLAQLLLVSTATGAECRRLLLLDQDFMFTTFCHILQSLLIAGSGNGQGFEGIVDSRNTHVVVVRQECVFEMQHVARITFNLHTWATVGVVHQVVSVRQRIIPATRAKPQIDGITVCTTLDIHISVTKINLAVLDLFLHLACCHHRIGAHLQHIVQDAVLSVPVFHEVATFAIHPLVLSDHLAHSLHDQCHASGPRRNQ